MKVVLLAGGFGSRISEESVFKPKPMIEIGGMPILWHIMKEYAYYGHKEFIICAGYKQEYIKEWFANYFLYNSDVTFNFCNGKNEMTVHHSYLEDWKVTVVDTGYNTMTGGRIRRVKEYVGNETFLMTYGDGVCDVDINRIIEFHKSHGKIATLTAVKQLQDKGVLNIGGDNAVKSFREKSVWIISAKRPCLKNYLPPMQHLGKDGDELYHKIIFGMSNISKVQLIHRHLIKDERGWFFKAITGCEEGIPLHTGEVYLTMGIQGQIKGGHYHPEAVEWFTVIEGEAILRLEDIVTHERREILLNFEQAVSVFVPNNVAHDFKNVGDGNMIILAYTDKLYDPADTIQYKL